MKTKAKLMLFACGLGLNLSAYAGRPLATEDADVLGRGSCEWESFGADTRGASSTRSVSTQVGCGLGLHSQLGLAHAQARSDGDTERTWTLGGKTHIVERHEHAPGVTLAWGTAWLSPPGQRLHHETLYLTLVASQEVLDGLLVHGNLGWSRSRQAAQDTTLWNLAVEKSIRQGVDVMAEVYGDDRGRPWLGSGLRWAATEALSLNVSYAVHTESPRTKLLTAGLKWGF